MGAEERGGSGGKLREGIRVILWHPQWDRPCRVCADYLFGDDGKVRLDAHGKPAKRIPLIPTPCRKCPKVPDEAKEQTAHVGELRKAAADMTDANRTAYERYREWKAVGRFPDDPIVTWYAGIIRDVEDRFTRYLADRQHGTLIALTTVLGVRNAR